MTIIKSKVTSAPGIKLPKISDLEFAFGKISPNVLRTPVWDPQLTELKNIFGSQSETFFKLELFQHSGSFKLRGALLNILNLSDEQLQKGVTAVSAGNHAIAVSYAAKELNTHAKVLMPETACPSRIEICKQLGADVVLAKDIPSMFPMVKEIEQREGRALIHPFDGYNVALGTGTLGLELSKQIENLDAVIVSIGGGGLISGVGCALKQLQPNCKIYGVEPEGANVMTRSFQAGMPQKVEKNTSIADSLSAAFTEEYSFELCSKFVDGIVNVSDDEVRKAMHFMFEKMKLAVEPAAATALAGAVGPLREELQNKRFAIIVCGTNTDVATLSMHLSTVI